MEKEHVHSGVPSQTVRTHLEEILTSPYFAKAPNLRKFLTYVVEAALAPDGAEIKEFVIATEVFGRTSDYDPQIDSQVRVEARRLRRKLEDYYRAEGVSSPIRIEIPKGSYLPVLNLQRREAKVCEPAQDVLSAASSGMATRASSYLRPVLLGPAVALLTVVVLWSTSLVGLLDRIQGPAIEEQSGHIEPNDLTNVLYLQADRLLRKDPLFRINWNGSIPPSVLEAIALFEELTRRSPGFARAWVGLGEAQEWAYELDRTHPPERLSAAKAALQRAVAIDANLSDAYSRLAAIYFYSDHDLDRAETSARRAAELNPRAGRVQALYAEILFERGNVDKALRQLSAALVLEPAASRLWAQQAVILYRAGRFDEALSSAAHCLTIDNGNQMHQTNIALWVKGMVAEQRGDFTQAEASYRRALDAYPQDARNQPSLGHLLGRTGREREARQILADLLRQQKGGRDVSHGIALLYAGLREHAQAIAQLKRGLESRTLSVRSVTREPRFDALKQHPLFQTLIDNGPGGRPTLHGRS